MADKKTAAPKEPTAIQRGQHAELETPKPFQNLKKGDKYEGGTLAMVSEVDAGEGFPEVSKEDVKAAEEIQKVEEERAEGFVTPTPPEEKPTTTHANKEG